MRLRIRFERRTGHSSRPRVASTRAEPSSRPIDVRLRSMKPRLFPLILLALAPGVSAGATAPEFEGRVNLQMRHGSESTPVTFLFKHHQMRMEVTVIKTFYWGAQIAALVRDPEAEVIGPGGVRIDRDGTTTSRSTITTIVKPETNRILMLLPSVKRYVVRTYAPQTASTRVKETAGGPSSLHRTGRSEQICGYRCDEYTARSGDDTIEMWLAEDIGLFALPSGGGPDDGKASAWEVALREKNLFPLRLVKRDAQGRERLSMLATGVHPGSVDDALFELPAGWTELKLAANAGREAAHSR